MFAERSVRRDSESLLQGDSFRKAAFWNEKPLKENLTITWLILMLCSCASELV